MLPQTPLAGFALSWLGAASSIDTPAGQVDDVLVARYRHPDGRSLVITQSARFDHDPYPVLDVSAAAPRDGRRIETGVADLVLGDASAPRVLPHAWGSNTATTVSIGGDLTSSDLVAVAATLAE